jgi:hypothetical protein
MEERLYSLEKELNELEKNNIGLHMEQFKKIKKNAIKLENEMNKILLNEEKEEKEEESEQNKDKIDINIEISRYTELVDNINNDFIDNMTIEELLTVYDNINKIEKNIVSYQRNKSDINIKII